MAGINKLLVKDILGNDIVLILNKDRNQTNPGWNINYEITKSNNARLIGIGELTFHNFINSIKKNIIVYQIHSFGIGQNIINVKDIYPDAKYNCIFLKNKGEFGLLTIGCKTAHDIECVGFENNRSIMPVLFKKNVNGDKTFVLTSPNLTY